ncbi:predicted protein [Sclerotinia sclerotiorum 1980 UF-70]|uniref:Uncharacterized protein n=1 Tax=Sclerotinia sclerotiorum (strain ATCC 18683 / 1980 / Ss-1) TaxID=665079 RepID=A7F0I1_SCLS1|nr:predicted protein [Sclerotinia sclerotiorum 1980 UF-70]EDN95223.1 predicted protein [Sclerotinia sclerotiorum 1980 UF-70]
MTCPIPSKNYPLWNNPILKQEYPRWNNLFNTIHLNNSESLRKILQAAHTAEKFHPFNLKLHANTILTNGEIIALRDFSYAFNRNFLGRDIIRYLVRREFCFCALGLGRLDENEDEDEARGGLDRWAAKILISMRMRRH